MCARHFVRTDQNGNGIDGDDGSSSSSSKLYRHMTPHVSPLFRTKKGTLRREATRLATELQALTHDKAAAEREASDVAQKREAELSEAREEIVRFREEAEKYKSAVAQMQSEV